MTNRAAASTASPRNETIASQRTISPMSDRGNLTPGCTDYTPRAENLLK